MGARGLHELVGFRSAKTWLRTHRPDGDPTDADLAARLREFPALRAAVDSATCPLRSARKVAVALRRCAPHLDRADGLIDAQPAEALLIAVVGNALAHVLRDLQGLQDEDPRLAALLVTATSLLDAGGTQLGRLEAVFTWVAQCVRPPSLSTALEELVLSVLPSQLEQSGERGHARRGLSLEPKSDGSGWHVCGDLDLECGERMWTALRAESVRDPRNPVDTAAWETARSEADGSANTAPDLPRTKRQRLHDALNRLLERYLEQGLGGTTGKSPVQVHVTLTEATVNAKPGAPPARGDSGRLIPRAMVRRWWCDSSVNAYVLSLGGKALRVIYAQRTLSAAERRALSVEGGGRCAGEGCCPETPDPTVVLRPHHVLHEGHRTVRLRDGRYLNEHGFTDVVSLFDYAPF